MMTVTSSACLFFLLPCRQAFLRQNLHRCLDRDSHPPRILVDPPVTVQRGLFGCSHLAQLIVRVDLQARFRRRFTFPGQSWNRSFVPRLLSRLEINQQGRNHRRRTNDCREDDTKKRDVTRSEIAWLMTNLMIHCCITAKIGFRHAQASCACSRSSAKSGSSSGSNECAFKYPMNVAKQTPPMPIGATMSIQWR